MSLDKAVAIIAPRAKADPHDATVLTALARALDARGEVLSQTDDNNGAAESLRASIDTYKQLIDLPGVTPDLLFEAADVYDILGDLPGQDTGFGDAAGALENYRKTIAINTRALAIDPNFMKVKRGLVTMQMKLGNVQLETDPQAALLNFRGALSASDALPKKDKERLNMLRLHALLGRKEGDALSELGRYGDAVQNFAESMKEYKGLAAADPKDFRALEDVQRELRDEAASYESAGDPRLVSSAAVRQHSLLEEERVLTGEEVTLRQLLAIDPEESRFKTSLESVQVKLDTVRYRLHKQESELKIASALPELKKDATQEGASSMILDLVVTTFLRAEPSTLRDPAFALSQARRGAELTHHKSPGWLLSLAEAYAAAGNSQEAHLAAEEGLRLLPRPNNDGDVPQIRKLLQAASTD